MKKKPIGPAPGTWVYKRQYKDDLIDAIVLTGMAMAMAGFLACLITAHNTTRYVSEWSALTASCFCRVIGSDVESIYVGSQLGVTCKNGASSDDVTNMKAPDAAYRCRNEAYTYCYRHPGECIINNEDRYKND